MTAEQFESGTGLAVTGYGQKIRVPDALRLAGQAHLGWIVHESTGAVLAHGDTKRIATPAQTRALIARDGGCSFPGRQDPPHWTERHHVIPWREGGPTDVENMCLLCGPHHRSIDTGQWRITMRNGVPWYTPPPWIDPTQTPIRNTRP